MGHLAICLLVLALISFVLALMINKLYNKLVANNKVNMDEWVQEAAGPSLKSKIQLLFYHWLSVPSGHKVSCDPIPLGEEESDFMEGLKVVVKEGKKGSVPHEKSSDCIVVGTI